MLRVNNITIGYGNSSLLSNVSFTVSRNETVSIIGANGCGKSTLFKCLQGKQKLLAGRAEWQNGLTPKYSSVEQKYRETLMPWLSVEENIYFPLTLKRLSKKQKTLRLSELMETLPIELPLAARANEISGGQAQLTALLRALMFQPDVLFLDEPFSALDYPSKWHIRQFLHDKLTAHGITTLIISHDPDDCVFLSNKVLTFNGSAKTPLTTVTIPLAHRRDSRLASDSTFIALKNQVVELAYGREIAFAKSLPLLTVV